MVPGHNEEKGMIWSYSVCLLFLSCFFILFFNQAIHLVQCIQYFYLNGDHEDCTVVCTLLGFDDLQCRTVALWLLWSCLRPIMCRIIIVWGLCCKWDQAEIGSGLCPLAVHWYLLMVLRERERDTLLIVAVTDKASMPCCSALISSHCPDNGPFHLLILEY